MAQVSIALVTVVVLFSILGPVFEGPYKQDVTLVGLIYALCICGACAPAAFLLALVALALRIREFYRPYEKPRCCVKCGCNLAGLRDPRCPECGTPFDANLLQQNQSDGGATSPPSPNADQ